MIGTLHNVVAYILSDPWFLVGFAGQFLFMMRFVIQWVHSERQRRSIVPAAFWFFSLAGGVTLLAYVIYRRDPVLIMGQALGLLIYLRNIYLIYGPGRASTGETDLEQARRLVDELTLQVNESGGDLRHGSERIEQALTELQRLLSKVKS